MTQYTSAYTGPQIDAALAKANTAVQPGSLGTAASADTEDFATAAQGAKADTAVQPADIGTAAGAAIEDFATAAQGTKADTAVQPAAIADFVSSASITEIKSLTQAEYDALGTADADILYVII